jgi:hypothetical protein
MDGADSGRAAVRALRRFASTYLGERRAAGELRTRLVAIEHERARWIEAAETGALAGRPDRQLAELDRVQGTLARSAAASNERLIALESVIAVIASEVVATGGIASDPAAPAPVSPSSSTRSYAVRPDASVRGGWSAPPPP